MINDFIDTSEKDDRTEFRAVAEVDKIHRQMTRFCFCLKPRYGPVLRLRRVASTALRG